MNLKSYLRDRTDWSWFLFQLLVGIVGCHLLGIWNIYWISFAIIEVVGLVISRPLTFSIRRFLKAQTGRWDGVLRNTLVAGWMAWFMITWMIFSTAPDMFKGAIMLVFLTWGVYHFFRKLRRGKTLEAQQYEKNIRSGRRN